MTKGDSRKCTHTKLSFKTPALVAGAVNVSLVFGLVVASMVLLQQKGDAPCKEKESQSVMVDNVRRYCFMLDSVECLEKGHDVKVEGNQTLCCGNLGEHIVEIMSEVSSF